MISLSYKSLIHHYFCNICYTFELQIAEGASVAVGDTMQLVHSELWLLGVVGTVTKEEGSALSTVSVKSPVNFNQMKWVVVTKDRLSIPVAELESALDLEEL